MFHSERRRGMPLTGWSLVLFFACVSRVFGVCVSVGSDRGATRIRKDAALGASAALTLLPLWIPLAPAAWPDSTLPLPSPSPKRGGDGDSFAVGYCGAEDFCDSGVRGTSTKNGDDVRQREYW